MASFLHDGCCQTTIQKKPAMPIVTLRPYIKYSSTLISLKEKSHPGPNNGTEQTIGRMKMRSRTVRGYKSWQGMEAALLLAGSGLDW
jgi:hypothetical protein